MKIKSVTVEYEGPYKNTLTHQGFLSYLNEHGFAVGKSVKGTRLVFQGTVVRQQNPSEPTQKVIFTP